MDVEDLQAILNHLLRQSPVQESEQRKWHQMVDQLHLSHEEKEAERQEAEQQSGDAPPGWTKNAETGQWEQVPQTVSTTN